jgi:four helix bundle protein
MQNDRFAFEGLDVYQVARGALGRVIANKAALRGLPGEIASQLERAAVSVVGNICEATGRVGLADRKHRFAIARGEANEAGGHIETIQLYGRFSDEDYRFLRNSYLRVTYMLTALIKR